MTMSMGAPPPEELLAQGGPEAAIPPAGPGDPMMDEAPPDPAEIAQMLGTQISEQRQQAHAMVDQAAEADLQQIVQLITQAAQGAQVLGPGQVA